MENGGEGGGEEGRTCAWEGRGVFVVEAIRRCVFEQVLQRCWVAGAHLGGFLGGSALSLETLRVGASNMLRAPTENVLSRLAQAQHTRGSAID